MPTATLRRLVIVWGILVSTFSDRPASGKTVSHDAWQFRIEVPEHWRVLGEGGIVTEPMVFSMGEEAEGELRIYRAVNVIGHVENPEDPAAIRAAIERTTVLFDQELVELNGIQASYQAATGGRPASIDTLASVFVDDELRHVITRSFLGVDPPYVLVSIVPTERLDAASPVIARVFDSFESTHETANPFWLAASLLAMLGGLALAGSRRAGVGNPGGSPTPYTLCVVAILTFAFLLTSGAVERQRLHHEKLLAEIERLETDFPGIARIDFDDRVNHLAYLDTVASFRRVSFEEGILALGLRVDRPSLTPIFTYALLHSSWSHLLWNVFFIALCGGVIERTAGKKLWSGTLVLGSVAAAAGHWWWHGRPDLLIGASGAASAAVGAAMVLGFWTPIGPSWERGGRRVDLRFPLGLVLTAWILSQLWEAAYGSESTALVLHASGFLFGVVTAATFHIASRARRGGGPPRGYEPDGRAVSQAA